MRHAKRTDTGHGEIRDGLRALGWEVLDTSGVGCGVPDLFVKLSPGRSLGLELKRADIKKAEQAMTAAEEVWWNYHWRSTRVVQTLAEAHEQATHAKEHL